MTRRSRIVALGALCVATATVALAAGASGWKLPWALTDVTSLRAPRVALAGIVGASLALAGVAMQALLRNDLADPFVLGLSGGASAGAVASLSLWPGLPPGPAAAAGAAAAVLLVRGLSRGAYDAARLLLAGVAVGSLLASLTGLILTLAPGAKLMRSSTYWLYGGFGTSTWPALVLPTVLLALALAWLLGFAERLDRVALGDDVAVSLGVPLVAHRRGILLVSVALTASAVAVSGLVGFVGLVAPHAARKLVGAPHRRLVPAAALLGAALVMGADAVARTAFAPREVPVGLVTAAVGGPFFLWQLRRGDA